MSIPIHTFYTYTHCLYLYTLSIPIHTVYAYTLFLFPWQIEMQGVNKLFEFKIMRHLKDVCHELVRRLQVHLCVVEGQSLSASLPILRRVVAGRQEGPLDQAAIDLGRKHQVEISFTVLFRQIKMGKIFCRISTLSLFWHYETKQFGQGFSDELFD